MNNYFRNDWTGFNFPNSNFFQNLEMTGNNNPNLFSPKEGFEKGNLFSNLYSQYKNYTPQSLNPKTEKEKKLIELQSICFAAHELNLYLDLHPEDQTMATLFNDYRRKADNLQREYEEQYGPLTVDSAAMEKGTFDWVNSPWPWEGNNV